MDTSKEYIEMCRQAEEIQSAFEYRGDEHQYRACLCGHAVFSGWLCPMRAKGEDHTVVWLPRQDQLQEMVNYHKCPTCHTAELYKFGEGSINEWDEQCLRRGSNEPHEWTGPKTMEQFWLAFIMWHKFKKRWNGGEWKEAQ